MTFQWDKVKEFLALPDGQKLLAACIFVLFVLCGVITGLILRNEKLTTRVNQCVENCAVEKLRMQQDNADTIKVILQREAQKDIVSYEAAIAKLEKREADLDAALLDAKRVVETQRRTRAQMRKTTSTVNKIVKDAHN